VRTLQIILTSAFISLLAGCSSNDKPLAIDDPNNNSIEALNYWVNANMNDYYYFANQVPKVNLADYDSPERLIRDLRVAPDTFSYVTTIEEYESFFVAGETFAFGFNWRSEDGPNGEENAISRLTQVYPLGPFGLNGAVRGDTIVSLNGIAWTDLTDEQWTDAVGTRDAPKVADWILNDIEGNVKNFSVARTSFTISSVMHHQVFSTPEFDGNIGYLVLRSFIDRTEAELD